jgi:long-chain acyl-CoA synthetase
VLAVRDSLPELRAVIVVDDPLGTRPDDVLLWSDLLADTTGGQVDIDDAVRTAKGDDLVTVIYTSGTTGNPKGVMLDHSNVAWQVAGYTELIGTFEPGLRAVSYLPMAHVAERMVTHYAWLWQRSVVTTCPEVSGLGEYLAAVQLRRSVLAIVPVVAVLRR